MPNQMVSATPLVIFKINKTTDLFNWQFKIGSKKENHLYEIWSRTHGDNNTNVVRNLTDLPRDPLPTKFNLTIICNFPTFEVQLNFWEPGNTKPIIELQQLLLIN